MLIVWTAPGSGRSSHLRISVAADHRFRLSDARSCPRLAPIAHYVHACRSSRQSGKISAAPDAIADSTTGIFARNCRKSLGAASPRAEFRDSRASAANSPGAARSRVQVRNTPVHSYMPQRSCATTRPSNAPCSVRAEVVSCGSSIFPVAVRAPPVRRCASPWSSRSQSRASIVSSVPAHRL